MRLVLFAFVLALAAPVVHAQTAPGRLIAVLPLDTRMAAKKLAPEAQASIEEMLRDVSTDLLSPFGWTVLTGETTIQILRDNGVDPAACGETECALASARELKAERFISGAVQFSDGEFTASIRLIETGTGRIAASAQLEGASAKDLRAEFRKQSEAFFRKAGLLARTVVEPVGPKKKTGAITEAVSRLKVTTRPYEDVRLELIDPDEKKIQMSSPYENSSAKPGKWKVVARLSGYEDQERFFSVPPDDDVLEKLELKQLGGLKVAGTPEGAKVTVTGPGGFKDEGGLPAEWDGLKSGAYEVKVKRTGYGDANEKVTVEPGRTTTVTVALKKGAAAGAEQVDPKTGYLFVSLPGGTFQMGCDPVSVHAPNVPGGSDYHCSESSTRDEVAVGPFWLGKIEVTVGQYAKCVKAGECEGTSTVQWADLTDADRTKYSAVCNYGKRGMDSHPINCVDWSQAKRFCAWIGGRLPDAAEWEWAASGGEGREFPWGKEPLSSERANYCDSECKGVTTLVGTYYAKGASKHGLYDLAGNVSEWTANSDATQVETRGGSWVNNIPYFLRAAGRSHARPSDRRSETGFRCAQ